VNFKDMKDQTHSVLMDLMDLRNDKASFWKRWGQAHDREEAWMEIGWSRCFLCMGIGCWND